MILAAKMIDVKPSDEKPFGKTVLAGLSLQEIKTLLKPHPAYRASQIFDGIFQGCLSFEEISSLPLDLRKELSEKFILVPGKIISEHRSVEGTRKLGIKLEDNSIIETVLLKDGKDRETVCISTQAGCPIGCIFCKTGSLGFKRNLDFNEIIAQYLFFSGKKIKPSHIVIMGMGEPLLNLAELQKAVEFFTDPGGFNISKRRITISTCGIVEGLKELCENGPDIRLAVSLVSARQELREKLIPISRNNHLEEVKNALLEYQKKRKKRITLEMVLMGGINTGIEDAEAAVKFASGLNVVFNLIPWNTVEGLSFANTPLKTPEPKELDYFTSELERHGLNVTKRYGKGISIQGACGQLGQVKLNQ